MGGQQESEACGVLVGEAANQAGDDRHAAAADPREERGTLGHPQAEGLHRPEGADGTSLLVGATRDLRGDLVRAAFGQGAGAVGPGLGGTRIARRTAAPAER